MSGIIAFLESIPAICNLVDKLVNLWIHNRITKMKNDVREGILLVARAYDQRPLETAIGSVVAGEHSGISGTQTVDSLPGVETKK